MPELHGGGKLKNGVKGVCFMIRYTKIRTTKDGDRVTTKIFTDSRIQSLSLHGLRGQYEYGRGNSYEYQDIW
jgi:hypothetical protein